MATNRPDVAASYARYRTPPKSLRGLGLVCLGSGWQRVRRITFEQRVLDCYGLVVVTRGGGWYAGEGRAGRRTPVSAPSAFMLFPGVRHSYQPDAEGWSEQWALFDGPAMEGYGAYGGFGPEQPVFRLGPGVRDLTETLERLHVTLATPAAHQDVLAAALVHELLARLLAAREDTDSSWVVRYLDEHAVEPLTVAEHAHRLGMSEEALRTEVRRATGSTPKDYLVRARMSRAEQMLTSTDRPVREVSLAVGYEDPAYFTRHFTARTGRTPSAFRRSTRP